MTKVILFVTLIEYSIVILWYKVSTIQGLMYRKNTQTFLDYTYIDENSTFLPKTRIKNLSGAPRRTKNNKFTSHAEFNKSFYTHLK